MTAYGSTDRIRQKAATDYIEPARRSGEKRVRIHSGTLNKELVESRILLPNRLPLVCNALTSRKFQRDNHLDLESVDGPPSGQSSTVVYTFRLKPVSGSPAQPGPAAPDPFLELRGVLRKTYKQLGGAEKFLKTQREAWGK